MQFSVESRRTTLRRAKFGESQDDHVIAQHYFFVVLCCSVFQFSGVVFLSIVFFSPLIRDSLLLLLVRFCGILKWNCFSVVIESAVHTRDLKCWSRVGQQIRKGTLLLLLIRSLTTFVLLCSSSCLLSNSVALFKFKIYFVQRFVVLNLGFWLVWMHFFLV